jgi:hypothetical protein
VSSFFVAPSSAVADLVLGQQERHSVSEEQNKMIVRRFIEEFWNERKLHSADELFAPDCITHQLRSEKDAVGTPRSPESVKREAAP